MIAVAYFMMQAPQIQASFMNFIHKPMQFPPVSASASALNMLHLRGDG
jgi:hypothetical protein